MLVAYLLLLLLHLSASTCAATGRNHRLFLPGAAVDAPAPSPPAVHDYYHRHAAKDFVPYDHDAHYHPATMMARRGGPPPTPPPGVGASGVVEGAPPAAPPGAEASGVGGGTIEPEPPSPSPRRDGGGAAEGGSSSSSDSDQEESATDDVGIDYEGPKTHPPSHN